MADWFPFFKKYSHKNQVIGDFPFVSKYIPRCIIEYLGSHWQHLASVNHPFTITFVCNYNHLLTKQKKS